MDGIQNSAPIINMKLWNHYKSYLVTLDGSKKVPGALVKHTSSMGDELKFGLLISTEVVCESEDVLCYVWWSTPVKITKQ